MKQRRRKSEQFRQKLVRSLKFIGLLFVIFAICWLTIEIKKFLKTNSLFQIENISFEHNDLFDSAEVRKILDSNYNLNIFGFNLRGLKSNLEKIPRIKNVVIKRKFPNIVQIKIAERIPIFLLLWKDTFYAVDKAGYMFPQLNPVRPFLDEEQEGLSFRIRDNPVFSDLTEQNGRQVFNGGKKRFRWDLPIITGLDLSPDQNFWCAGVPEINLAFKIASYIDNANLHLPLRLSESHFGKFDEIFVYTFNPRLELRLSKDNLDKKFENLSLVLADLGDEINLVDYIDLRLEKKVFAHFK